MVLGNVSSVEYSNLDHSTETGISVIPVSKALAAAVAITTANNSNSEPNACKILVTIPPISKVGYAVFQKAAWIAIEAVRPCVPSSSPIDSKSTRTK
ncbi:unnamed protein product [[Candida] boidinii]|nr:unnamed protein product [[Candida] boidinii]